MAEKIARISAAHIDVAVTNSTSTSGTFQMAEKAGGLIHVVLGSGTVTFYSLPDINSSQRFLLKDASGSDITLTVAEGNCYALPDALFAAKRVQPVLSSGNGTMRVLLKT